MLFSIVVPVFNVEKYIRESFDSILSQTGTSDYEVVIVDDGSTDNSGSICDEYAQRYNRFKVFHTENHGVCAARNLGIENSSGEYILFLDPDDYWSPKLIETVAPLCHGSDMVLFNCADFYDESGQSSVRNMCSLPMLNENGRDYLKRLSNIGELPVFYMWSCAFRREFIEKYKIRADVSLKCSEDFDFNMQAYTNAERLCGCDTCLYFYRQHSNSITASTLHSDRVMQNLRIKAKWFREFPIESLADLYVCQTLLLADLGKGEKYENLVSFIKENRDLFSSSHHPNYRILKLLYCIFGYRRGAVMYRKLQSLTRG